ncbi:MAG: hypothetical protein LGR52_12675 [Candidatus Thiosymbion ectosymbiont of Robbea hypermnestra]|nr:hypothetical protein [Candidatus Thiosymbion ectosymbiont of Robbea hypermnestra]
MITWFPKAASRVLCSCVLAIGLFAVTNGHAALVFSVLEDGVWQLYHQVDFDAPPQRIPAQSVSGDKGAPRLSPDGKRVAFEVTGAGLYVCSVQGEETCRQVSVEDGYPRRPTWNPHTGDLAFSHYVFAADREVATIKLASDDLASIRPLIAQTGIQDFPDMAPDGRRLAYTSWLTLMPYRGGISVVQQLWTLDIDRGKAGQLLLSNAGDIHPRWSPDGSRIAFSSNRTGRYELWTIGADGADLRRMTDGPGDKTWPTWSPDGTRILFTHTQTGRSDLSLVRVDKSKGNEKSEIRPYRPFGADSGFQLRDADWRRVTD